MPAAAEAIIEFSTEFDDFTAEHSTLIGAWVSKLRKVRETSAFLALAELNAMEAKALLCANAASACDKGDSAAVSSAMSACEVWIDSRFSVPGGGADNGRALAKHVALALWLNGPESAERLFSHIVPEMKRGRALT